MYGNSLLKDGVSNEVLSFFDYSVVFGENKRNWRESFMTLFKALPRHSSRRTEKTTMKLT